MDEELKKLWKISSETESITFNLNQLLMGFKQRMEHQEKAIRRRDRREILAALVVIFLFGYLFLEVPLLLSKIACLLTILGGSFIIYKLRVNQKSRYSVSLFLSLKEELNVQKKFMKSQAKLLDSVLYWYILPILIPTLIFVWSIGNPADDHWNSFLIEVLPVNTSGKILFTSVTVAFNVYVFWLNKQAVKQSWNPLIEEIENIEKEF